MRVAVNCKLYGNRDYGVECTLYLVNGNTEYRIQKSEVRSQKSEVRSQKSEFRSQKSEVRS